MRKFLAAVVLLASTFTCFAQIQNRLGVDEDIFRVYANGRLSPYDEKNIATGDSLLDVAAARNDYKIKTLALNLKLTPFFSNNRMEELDETMEQLKELRHEHSDISDIYNAAMYTYCQSLTLANKISDALLNAREMSRLATEMQDPYGMMLAYRSLGFIYEYRGNHLMAYNSYLAALPLCADAGAPQEEFSLHVLLAEQLIAMNRPAEAEAYLAKMQEEFDESVPWAPTQIEAIRFLLYHLGHNKEKYADSYSKLIADPNLAHLLDEDTELKVKAFHYMDIAEYDSAIEAAENITNDYVRNSVKADIMEAMGNYKEAVSLFHDIFNAKDSLSNVIQSEDIAMMDAELDLSSMKMKADLAEAHRRSTISSAIVLIATIIIFFMLLTVLRHRRQSRILEEKNAALSEAQATTEKALKQAQEASQAKQRFVQNMSHEIRTPLNAIVGFSQLLSLPEDLITNEEREQYQGYVMNNSNMLMMLVDDILNASDIDSGNYQMFISPSSCNEICRAAMTGVEYRIPENLKYYMTSDLPDSFKINTDPRRIQQILTNYLTNACKHTEDGEIHIHCGIIGLDGDITPERIRQKVDEGCPVYFSVSDTGCGVPADKAEAIFERFTKLDQFVQGTGLGLNICRELATRLGGTAYLDTTYVAPAPYTSGSRFILTLPANGDVEA